MSLGCTLSQVVPDIGKAWGGKVVRQRLVQRAYVWVEREEAAVPEAPAEPVQRHPPFRRDGPAGIGKCKSQLPDQSNAAQKRSQGPRGPTKPQRTGSTTHS